MRSTQRTFGWRMRHAVGWIATILVLATANPVAADPEHFGSNWGHGCDETKDSQCKANNGSHVVNLWNLQADMEDAATFILLNRYQPLAGVVVGIYTDEQPLDEDVIVKDFNVEDNGDIGFTRCATESQGEGVYYGGSAADHTRWCRPQIVIYDTTYDRQPTDTVMGYGTQAKRRWLNCHELGHTLGLRHRNDTFNSCMHQYPADRSDHVLLESVLIPHDENHIESAYS